ncbi:SYP124 protein [Hibiscus syriacus]|uniref:SYP124 protein n=1 Tax=Hibiscus syriacus TaxID=106335 RepID=A0A6A3CUI1_HIBSY|nr:SYP124 protein [Hibiscus syriacus]
MNDLISSSFKKYTDPKEQAYLDEMEAGTESADRDNFFEQVENVKEDMKGVEQLYKALQEANEECKTAHAANTMKQLHSRMDDYVEEVFKRVNLIKGRLEGLERSNAASRNVPGSSTDRTRTSVVSGLGKKLKDMMDGFQELRARMQAEYKETVERRYFTITGEKPDEETIENLISSGERQSKNNGGVRLWTPFRIFKKAEEDPMAVALDMVDFWVFVNDMPVGLISEQVARQFGNFLRAFVEYDSSVVLLGYRGSIRLRASIDTREFYSVAIGRHGIRASLEVAMASKRPVARASERHACFAWAHFAWDRSPSFHVLCSSCASAPMQREFSCIIAALIAALLQPLLLHYYIPYYCIIAVFQLTKGEESKRKEEEEERESTTSRRTSSEYFVIGYIKCSSHTD